MANSTIDSCFNLAACSRQPFWIDWDGASVVYEQLIVAYMAVLLL